MRLVLVVLLTLLVTACESKSLDTPVSFDVGFSPNGQALNLVLKSINSAKTTIRVAAYSFTSKPIALALLNAKNRGVDVQVIADEKSNSRKYSAVSFLANHGIPVRLDGKYPIFHHKFIIIDNNSIETGSFNYSQAAATKNAENVLVLWNVPKIANTYNSEWSHLWLEAEPFNAKY